MTHAAEQIRALIPSNWEVHLTEWNMHGDYWNMTNGAAITTATWIGVQNATDAAFLYGKPKLASLLHLKQHIFSSRQ